MCDRRRCLFVDESQVVRHCGVVASLIDPDGVEERTVGVAGDGVAPLVPHHVTHRGLLASERRERSSPGAEHRVLLDRSRQRESVATHPKHSGHRPSRLVSDDPERSVGRLEELKPVKRVRQRMVGVVADE